MGAAPNIYTQLETVGGCASCGVDFAVPVHFINMRRQDKKTFYCPNGHVLSFTESEVDRLKRELEGVKNSLQFARDGKARVEKSLIAQKAQTTKARNQLERVGNGVCPCCNRTFQNLMRHMSTKHPDFKKQEPA